MDEPVLETELAETEAQHRAGPWRLIAIVVVITLVGIWLVPDDAPDDGALNRQAADTPSATDRLDTPPSLLGDASITETEGDPSIALAPTEAGLRGGQPGSRARALIAKLRAKGAPDLDRIHQLAVKAQADGEMADAYLLYFFAAREGHAASALALGLQADPASRDPADSVFEIADLNQAHKWYQIAARDGSSDGQQRLTDLRDRIEKLAANGDAQARRIALLWQ